MQRAIDAARRAFDETIGRSPRLPPAVSPPAARGARRRTGSTARRTDPRGRLPTHGHARAAARLSRWPMASRTRRGSSTSTRGKPSSVMRWSTLTGTADDAQGVARTGRRGRRDRARGTIRSRSRSTSSARRSPPVTRSCSSRRPTPRTTRPARPPRRRAHRHPARRRQRRYRVGPPRRRRAHPVAEGRPHLVHRLDRGRQADHGEGRGDDEAPVPRARRQVGRDRARGRRPRRGEHDRLRRRACTPGRAARPRRGCCCRGPDTTRASSSSRASTRSVVAGRSPTARHPVRTGHLGQAARARLGYIQKGIDEGANLLVGGTEAPGRSRQGLLRRADVVRRRRQHDDDRAGGDLRAGPRRHSRTTTTRTRSASRTTATTGSPAT